MKLLYKVSIEHTIYVLAETVSDARYIARHRTRDDDPRLVTYEVDSESQIEPGWLHAVPFDAVRDDLCESRLTCVEALAYIHSICSVNDCDSPVVPEGGDVCEEHVGNEAP